ncbi:phosphoribosylanthranilate isomerase [Flavobacteriaceae bacterium]|nr:phosphoribosylanthranilate isomerase [Flavobacteriaceae bacterium]MDA8762887.1 phosphoribosylanthranilate isomerase [Flavobacteriaceae bacterium]
MKLKVCGMRAPDNIAALSDLAPDYMGFIFWENSKRFVNNPTPDLPASIKKTGVFVDASPAYITDMVKHHQLQAVQLHGEESPNFCQKLNALGLEIIKAFAVDASFDFSVLEAYETVCNYFLFDTKGPLPGGNGNRFDWSVLRNYPSAKPFFLSGGIGPGDQNAIASIINLNLPLYAIDINSQFEIEPGLKNIEIIKQFKATL